MDISRVGSNEGLSKQCCFFAGSKLLSLSDSDIAWFFNHVAQQKFFCIQPKFNPKGGDNIPFSIVWRII